MRIALPVWETQISPVLDTARHICVYTIEKDAFALSGEHLLPESITDKATFIAARADVLICGALSCRLERELAVLGITVHPWIMGDIDKIATAFADGEIQNYEYSMPGCRKQHGHGRCGRGKGRMGHGH